MWPPQLAVIHGRHASYRCFIYHLQCIRSLKLRALRGQSFPERDGHDMASQALAGACLHGRRHALPADISNLPSVRLLRLARVPDHLEV